MLLHDCIDDCAVVGGVVPPILIDAHGLDAQVEAHPGTTDLDLALALSVLDRQHHETIASRLRRSGFAPTLNEHGNPTRQRWGATHGEPITIDFLIPPTATHAPGQQLRSLTSDLAAIVTEGADLAHRDRVRVRIEGRTLRGAHAARDVWVCGPAAFVVLKAPAFPNRGKDKDAYDLLYVLRNHPAGVAQIAATPKGFGEHAAVTRALAILSEDFDDIELRLHPGGAAQPEVILVDHFLPGLDQADADSRLHGSKTPLAHRGRGWPDTGVLPGRLRPPRLVPVRDVRRRRRESRATVTAVSIRSSRPSPDGTPQPPSRANAMTRRP